jgi:voltage-gated potassium channel Kch
MLAILAPLVVLVAFFREFWDLFKQPKYRSFIYWLVILLAAGTIFYSIIEGWSILDSLYFSVVSLATVGYGDLVPITPAGKLFSIFFILFGLSMLATFVNLLAKERQSIFARRHGDDSEEV